MRLLGAPCSQKWSCSQRWALQQGSSGLLVPYPCLWWFERKERNKGRVGKKEKGKGKKKKVKKKCFCEPILIASGQIKLNFQKSTRWIQQGIMKSFGRLILCKCQQRHRELLLLVPLLILSHAFSTSSCFCLLLVSQCCCWRPSPGGWSSENKDDSTKVPNFPAVRNLPEGSEE